MISTPKLRFEIIIGSQRPRKASSLWKDRETRRLVKLITDRNRNYNNRWDSFRLDCLNQLIRLNYSNIRYITNTNNLAIYELGMPNEAVSVIFRLIY